MLLLCDYFLAPSDAAARNALAQPPGARRAVIGSAGDQYPTMSLAGMEPSIALVRLEELLTGRSWEEISGDPTGVTLAINEEAMGSIVSITETLQQALSDADDGTLRRIAVPWSEPDDLRGCQGCNAVAAADLLVKMAAFIRRGRRDGLRLYCRTVVAVETAVSA
ncbi:MAG: hypothetical protein ACLP62_02785 [Acidimicrobiales bacterium]